MFSSAQKNLFCFWSLMTTLCSCECQNYNSFMFKLYSCYVRLLCSTIIYLYYYVQKMSKLYPLGTKNKTKKNCKDENISFYFLGIKIKI